VSWSYRPDLRHCYKIWQHELEWLERKRALGTVLPAQPNERSTAVRRGISTSLYPALRRAALSRMRRNSRLFLRLTNRMKSPHRTQESRCGPGSCVPSSGYAKPPTSPKHQTSCVNLVQWLQKNMAIALEVTYQGRAKSLTRVARGKSIRELSA